MDWIFTLGIALCIGIPIVVVVDLLVRRTKQGFGNQEEEVMLAFGIITLIIFLTAVFEPVIIQKLTQ